MLINIYKTSKMSHMAVGFHEGTAFVGMKNDKTFMLSDELLKLFESGQGEYLKIDGLMAIAELYPEQTGRLDWNGKRFGFRLTHNNLFKDGSKHRFAPDLQKLYDYDLDRELIHCEFAEWDVDGEEPLPTNYPLFESEIKSLDKSFDWVIIDIFNTLLATNKVKEIK